MVHNYVDELVKNYDKNHDGYINIKEAKMAAKEFDISEKELRELCKKIKPIKGHENEVPINNISDEIKRHCVETFKKYAFQKLFDLLDENKSGTLSFAETQEALRHFNVPTDFPGAKDLFDAVDSNKDEEIDLTEYFLFIKEISVLK